MKNPPWRAIFLIVDEASMLDLALSNHLLKAIPPGMHLLLVGDVDQLPSVGAGNVLNDIIQAIEMTRLPLSMAVVRLQTIFRQSANSFIIANAHRINQGVMPEISNDPVGDFFLFKTDDPERAAQLCVELVQTRIPQRFAILPQDIQVLSPMHRGIVGVAALNQALQASLNPPAPGRAQRQMGSRVYRLGDRVMQIRNNYDKDVYNGDMGTISALDLEMQKVTVIMDGRAVSYDFLEAGRTGARLCHQRAQESGIGVSGCRYPHAYQPLHDATAQLAVYRCKPGATPGRPGRSAEGDCHGRAQQQSHRALYRFV